MTAEEKLKELYESARHCPCGEEGCNIGGVALHTNNDGAIYLAPEHIDLIANLVIERLIEGAGTDEISDNIC